MTSNILQVLENHAPDKLIGGYYQCKARGCFFTTAPGHDSWDGFAQHQTDMLALSGVSDAPVA